MEQLTTTWMAADHLVRGLNALREGHWVAIDTETGSPFDQTDDKAGLKPYAGAYAMGFSVAFRWWDEIISTYVPLNHKVGPNIKSDHAAYILHALTHTRATHVFHNAQFDWAVLENLGLGFQKLFNTIDTATIAWLGDENRTKALKPLAAQYLGANEDHEQQALKSLMHSGWTAGAAYKHLRESFPEWPVTECRKMAKRMARDRGWVDLSSEEIASYAAKDTELTGRLAEYFLGENLPVWQEACKPLVREMQVMHLTYEMTRRGIRLDPDQLAAADHEYTIRREILHEHLASELIEMDRIGYGPNDKKPNPGSSDQIARLLFERYALTPTMMTPGGKPSTGKDALEMLQGHEIVAQILAYRKYDKAISAYTSSLKDYLAKSPDGRIHTHFNTGGTVTGRLSASLPNLMQIPKGDKLPELRAAFVPEPGMELWEYDIVSAELYVTASITKDPLLTAQLLEGRDMHTETAEAMFGRSDGRWRTLAKNVNYGSAYEAGPSRMAVYAAKAGLEPGAAKRMGYKIADDHRRLYAVMHEHADMLAQRAKERGRLQHPGHPGRYRHFRSPGKDIAFYTAMNAMVQGGIGEFVKDVMVEVGWTSYRQYLLLQIHDALVFELEPGMAETLGAFLNAISEEVNVFDMPLRWEAKQWAVTATS